MLTSQSSSPRPTLALAGVLGRCCPAPLLYRARCCAVRLPGSSHRSLPGPAGATHGRREPPRGARWGSTQFRSRPSGSGLRSLMGPLPPGIHPGPGGAAVWALEELVGQEKKLTREREGSKPSDKVVWVPPMCIDLLLDSGRWHRSRAGEVPGGFKLNIAQETQGGHIYRLSKGC
jgi:hypothetical protein